MFMPVFFGMPVVNRARALAHWVTDCEISTVNIFIATRVLDYIYTGIYKSTSVHGVDFHEMAIEARR